ncbi:MAG: CPBP family intramembrane glutamic endopeptidase [Gemmataceae bacterium]
MTETESEDDRNGIVLLAIAVEGGLVLLALLLGWLFNQPPLTRFDLDAAAAVWGLLAAGPMLVLVLVLMQLPLPPLVRLRALTENVFRPVMAPCTLVDLFGISCLAGLGEEMVFRGVVQDALVEHLSTGGAIVAAAVVFGLVHAVTPTYAVLAAGMGAYLGWLYVATDNLLAPMVTHAAYDFVLLVYLLREPDDEEDEDEPADEDDEEE